MTENDERIARELANAREPFSVMWCALNALRVKFPNEPLIHYSMDNMEAMYRLDVQNIAETTKKTQ